MSKPGALVIGTGFGCLTHIPALREAGFDIAGLVGRNPERTADRAARFDVTPFTDLDAALNADGVDAVTIATPPHSHHDIVIAAAQAGKHVLCEKPFARDTAEAEAMLAAVEDAGVVHLLGTEFRWDPQQEMLRRIVTSGGIGTPVLATFMLHIPMLAAAGTEVPDWWGDASHGGGWLGAHGSHLIDQIRTTLGEITGLHGSLATMSEQPWTAEDTYSVHFRTESGASGILQSSASDRGPMMAMARIAGSAGAVWLDAGKLWHADNDGTREVEIPAELAVADPAPPAPDLMHTAYDLLHSTGMDFGPWVAMAQTFKAQITGTEAPATPPPATFKDGVALMKVLDAIRTSATTRAWVELTQ